MHGLVTLAVVAGAFVIAVGAWWASTTYLPDRPMLGLLVAIPVALGAFVFVSRR